MKVQLPTIVLVAYGVVIGNVATFLLVWNRWDACDLHSGVREALLTNVQMKTQGQGAGSSHDLT